MAHEKISKGMIRMKKFNVIVNGECFEVLVEEAGAATLTGFRAAPVPARPAPPPRVAAPAPSVPAPSAAPVTPKPQVSRDAGMVTAPMPGNINTVKVCAGEQVKAGDVLLVLEAMKMENEITAPVAGTVKEVVVKEEQTVQAGEVLVVIG